MKVSVGVYAFFTTLLLNYVARGFFSSLTTALPIAPAESLAALNSVTLLDFSLVGVGAALLSQALPGDSLLGVYAKEDSSPCGVNVLDPADRGRRAG